MLCLTALYPRGPGQLESSRRLAEIQELHQSVRAAAEEARRKEEVYKQLVRSLHGGGGTGGEVGPRGALVCLCLDVRARDPAQRRVPAGLHPAHLGDRGQHPQTEGRDHEGAPSWLCRVGPMGSRAPKWRMCVAGPHRGLTPCERQSCQTQNSPTLSPPATPNPVWM